MNEDILSLLRCPETGGELSLKSANSNKATFESASGTQYPMVKGLPWLFKDPDKNFKEWGVKAQYFIEREKSALKILQSTMEQCDSEKQKKRINLQREGRSKNLRYLEKCLADFTKVKPFPMRPSTQQINSYFELIFRDWSWQTEEVELYFKFLDAQLEDKAQRILVLGSGAGGLSYKLASTFKKSTVISVEHNPFLALTSQHILEGKALKLFEVNNYPKQLEDSAVKRDIKVDKLDGENHQLLLCSFPDLPFASQSFDVIITPWFLDILDLPFADALSATLNFLKDDGLLLHFGPSNIHKNATADQLCHEEVLDYFNQHFNSVESQQETSFYLDSPANSKRRLEAISFMACKGVKQRQDSLRTDYEKLDIKMTEQLAAYQKMVFTHFQVLSQIHHDMSLTTLAKLMEEKLGFESHESEFYAELFYREIVANTYWR